MNFDRTSAIEFLDQSINYFEDLANRLRTDGISVSLIEDYNEIYTEAINLVESLFSEDEAFNFSQETATPSYEMDPVESEEAYRESIISSMGLLEEYRQRLSVGENIDMSII